MFLYLGKVYDFVFYLLKN